MNITPTPPQRSLAWAWVGIAGAVTALLGSLLPWVSVVTFLGTIDVAGTKGDGKITLVLAFAAGTALLVATTKRAAGTAIAAGIVASAGFAVAGYDAVTLSTRFSNVNTTLASIQLGFGMYLCLLGFAAAAVGGFVTNVKIKTRNRDTRRPLAEPYLTVSPAPTPTPGDTS